MGGRERREADMATLGRTLAASLAVIAAVALAPGQAGARRPEPTPEPNFAVNVLPRPCAYEGGDKFERRSYQLQGWRGPDYVRYPGACERLRFAYGPIHVKPGQNDVLIEPVKIEKPMRDGYITRFKPNLVLPDGTVPPVEQVHLHHGTWNSVPPQGMAPMFAAAGEEKTVIEFPRGFGMPIKATDQWTLLYMVHSAVQQPMEVYITYDVDFVPKTKGDALGIRPAIPVWLDVRPSFYPVLNVQRDFGGPDGRCTWPKEQCAAHDPFGKLFTGQGKPGNGRGTDLKLPAAGESTGRIKSFTGGSLIAMGGHVHPGGLENQIDLVRPTRRRARSVRIYNGEPTYWNRRHRDRPGGPPTSWDFSMEVSRLPFWGVRVRPGDVLRSNVTYDTRHQSTYEDMGIVIALLALDDGKRRAPGVDPFTVPKDRSEGCRSGGIQAKPARLCDKGLVTHGHLEETENYGHAAGTWKARRGVKTNDVAVAGFLYQPGDLSMISMTGVPTVKLGTKLRFTNLEGAAIYHTATSCAFPCLGPTGTSFPLANGRTSRGRSLDFDSSEEGVGIPTIGPAKQSLDYVLPVTPRNGFKRGEVVTYFCRIHPSMRGAFEVTGK
jgi:hypothetical protein